MEGSRIEGSRLEDRGSRDRDSRIEVGGSRVEDRVWRVEVGESRLEDRGSGLEDRGWRSEVGGSRLDSTSPSPSEGGGRCGATSPPSSEGGAREMESPQTWRRQKIATVNLSAFSASASSFLDPGVSKKMQWTHSWQFIASGSGATGVSSLATNCVRSWLPWSPHLLAL